MPDRRLPDWPRVLGQDSAAAYCGISPSAFRLHVVPMVLPIQITPGRKTPDQQDYIDRLMGDMPQPDDPRLQEVIGCPHPAGQIQAGPRIPRTYGDGPTQVCGVCKAWRTCWGEPGRWYPAESLAEAMEEDNGR
jgi:hypothetical protein